jgi:hypothetical protein
VPEPEKSAETSPGTEKSADLAGTVTLGLTSGLACKTRSS